MYKVIAVRRDGQTYHRKFKTEKSAREYLQKYTEADYKALFIFSFWDFKFIYSKMFEEEN